MSQALELRRDYDAMTEEEVVRTLKQKFAILQNTLTNLLSTQQSKFIALQAELARSWAEMIERLELHSWEHQYQLSNYQDRSGIGLTLTNGWIAFDAKFRNALLAKNVTLPANMKFIRLGPADKLFPALASAEVYWSSTHTPQSTARSRLPVYWGLLYGDWQFLQTREGTSFTNTKQYENRIGDDLLLEMTGDGQLPSGLLPSGLMRIYVADRVNAHGTATVVCFVFSSDVGYDSCRTLTNTLRVPGESVH